MTRRKLDEYRDGLLGKECARFERSLREGSASSRKDGDIAAQSRRYQVAQAEFRRLEAVAREVLMRHGVRGFGFIDYYRFVRHLGSMQKQAWGGDFAIVARAAVGRWSGQGCDPKLLQEIVLAAFNLRLDVDSLPGQE